MGLSKTDIEAYNSKLKENFNTEFERLRNGNSLMKHCKKEVGTGNALYLYDDDYYLSNQTSTGKIEFPESPNYQRILFSREIEAFASIKATEYTLKEAINSAERLSEKLANNCHAAVEKIIIDEIAKESHTISFSKTSYEIIKSSFIGDNTVTYDDLCDSEYLESLDSRKLRKAIDMLENMCKSRMNSKYCDIVCVAPYSVSFNLKRDISLPVIDFVDCVAPSGFNGDIAVNYAYVFKKRSVAYAEFNNGFNFSYSKDINRDGYLKTLCFGYYGAVRLRDDSVVRIEFKA